MLGCKDNYLHRKP